MIQGNRAGLDATGATAGNGYRGIYASNLTGATISGNLLSGNGYDGLLVQTATALTISGNLFGVDPTGEIARPKRGPWHLRRLGD